MFTLQHKTTTAQTEAAPAAPERARQRSHATHVPAWTSTLTLRPKLTVTQPGDVFEQDADRAAERVMRMSEPALQREPCANCPDDEQPVQRKEHGGTTTIQAPDSVHHTINRPGQPLDSGTRAFMEPRFGQDFNGVRIHTDAEAAQSAADVSARAYTVGQNIVFGAGEYAPGGSEGMRLLAHELAHTVQQGGNESLAPRVQRQLFPPVPIIVNPPRVSAPVEINAVDARQEESTEWYKPWRYTGPITNFFRGDVTMTDINSMVTNVIAHLNGRRMHRLNIMDHGNSSGVEIGSDWLASAADVSRFAGTLGTLRSHFASGAIVHFQNCKSGQNQALICALAAALGATVYAGTGFHNPLLGFNTGDYVSCTPGGTFNPNAGRPSTPTPPPEPASGYEA